MTALSVTGRTAADAPRPYLEPFTDAARVLAEKLLDLV
jgi:hypothetical protein